MESREAPFNIDYGMERFIVNDEQYNETLMILYSKKRTFGL